MPSFPALPGENRVQVGSPSRGSHSHPDPAPPAPPPARRPGGDTAAAVGSPVGTAPSPRVAGSPPPPPEPGPPPPGTAATARPVDLYPGEPIPARYQTTPYEQLPAVIKARISRAGRPSP